MTQIRCAIYTRKSSEEGLEQEFNSLDAQREACEAYIKSQKSTGWVALPDVYDDGGISGGTMDRPALQRLLADIGAGRVDTVVVYKVDRLTRSLNDFAKIVEAFDSKDVSFVSVTQQFNTTTSMGRLTLDMLLSFAQFEREEFCLALPIHVARKGRATIGARASASATRLVPDLIRDRGVETERDVDGRHGAARLRCGGPQARRECQRGRDRPSHLPPVR
jgi:predicted site-specific integrase-resolvase